MTGTGNTLPPVVAVLEGNVSHFENAFGHASSSVKTHSGVMSAEMNKVEQSAQKMGQQVEQSATKGSGGLGGMVSSLTGMGGGALAAVGAVTGVGIAIGGVGEMALAGASKFKDLGLEVGKLARMTGEGAVEMSKWDFAAKDSGVSADSLGKGYKFLSKDLEDAGSKGSKALAGIGVATHDATGKVRPMNDVMLDVADKMSHMEDASARNKLAMDLFGKSGMDLIPMLMKGKGGISDLMEEAEKFGMVMDDAGVQKSKDAAKAQRELGFAWDGLQMQLGQYVLPILTSVTKWFTEHLQPAIAAVKPALEWLADAWGNISSAFQNEGPSGAMDKFLDYMGQIGQKIGPILGDLWNSLIGWIGDHWQDLIAAWAKWQATMYGWVAKAIPPLMQKLGELLAKIGDWISTTGWPMLQQKLQEWRDAFVKWVGDSWPGWVANAAVLLQNIGNWIRGTALPAIVAKLTEWRDAAVAWIIDAAKQAPGKLMQFLGGLIDWLANTALPAILRKGRELGIAFVQWLIDRVKALPNDLAEWMGVLRDWLEELPGKVLEFAKDAGKWLWNVGGDLLRGLVDGAKDFFTNEIPKFAGWVKDTIGNNLKAIFGMSSPSRVMMEHGRNIAAGLGIGMTDQFREDGTLERLQSFADGSFLVFHGGQLDTGASDMRGAAREQLALDAQAALVIHQHSWDFRGAIVGDEHAVMTKISDGLRRRDGAVG